MMTSFPYTSYDSAVRYARNLAKSTRRTWNVNRLTIDGDTCYEATTAFSPVCSVNRIYQTCIVPPQRRPDYTFLITVSPVRDVYPCAERLAEESRGMFGFHDSERCAECKYVERGWELWTEQLHLCGRARTREELVHVIKARVVKQWRATTAVEYPKGSLIGYQFRMGGQLTYLGR